MKARLSVIVGALALGLAATSAHAQGNSLSASTDQQDIIPDAGKLIYNYDVDNVIPVLQQIGYRWEGRTAPNGEKLILVTAGNGLNFTVRPMACQQGANSGCLGINLIAGFGGTADQRTVNSFNYRYSFASAGLTEDGVAFLSRYEIADYGVPRGNLASSIVNYVALAEMFQRTISVATKTVSQKSYVDDMAADSLNMQALFDDPEMAARAGVARNTHTVAFEQAADFVDVLVAAEEKNPGKILNFVNKPKQ